jgi:hypothetical protein
MHLTFVKHERDNSSAWKADWEWPEVVHYLTTHRRLPAKGDIAAIFARFFLGKCRRLERTGKCTDACPGTDHRIDENVESVTALALDFDDAPKARLEAFIGQLITRGVRFLWYTTWSSTPDHPKIRIVIFLDAEVPRDQFRGFWDAAVDELGIRDIVDTTCRNPGRLFFTPQCPVDGQPHAGAYEGKPLETGRLLARVTPDTPPVATNAHTYPPASQALIHHALERLRIHGPAIQDNAGNPHTRAAWGILVNDLALSEHEARAVFRVWDLQNVPPWGEEAFTGPCRSDQAWSGPRGAERDRFEHSTENVFGEKPPTPPTPWSRGPEIAALITQHANEPWIDLHIGTTTIAAVRPGGIVTLVGGTGGGKTSLAANMLLEHAVRLGPAISMTLELPVDEWGGRAIGIQNDEGWVDVLRGRSKNLILPQRLAIIGREHASLPVLVKAIDTMQTEYPGQPILVVIDYAQIMPASDTEMRMRITRVMADIDMVVRGTRVVGLVLSQGSRASSKKLASGEALGADTTDSGAESAALERWSSVTMAIGEKGPMDEHGIQDVELNIGKGRMGGGDQIYPCRFNGRTGRFAIAGNAKAASKVREERAQAKVEKKMQGLADRVRGILERSPAPMSKNAIVKELGVNAEVGRQAVDLALATPTTGVVQVDSQQSGKNVPYWTRARATDAGQSQYILAR